MNPRLQTWGMAGLASALVLAIVAGAQFLWEKQSQAQTAADHLHQTRELTERIQLLHQTPTRATSASSGAKGPDGEAVEQAARTAQLSSDSIGSIESEPPVRTENTSYKLQSTRIALKAVTLGQLDAFLEALCQTDSILRVTEIVLAEPAGNTGMSSPTEVWQAEVQLTRIVFDPITAP